MLRVLGCVGAILGVVVAVLWANYFKVWKHEEATGGNGKSPNDDLVPRLTRIDPVKVGFVRDLHLVSGQVHQMKTLSMRPALFEIENFLTPEECDDIKFMAETQGLEDSRTLLHGVFEVNDTTIAELIADPDTSFRNADSNKDGVIDKDELAAGISFIGDISLGDQAIDDLMTEIELDTDKDNVLSRQEFHAMLNNKTFQEIINYTNNMKQSEPNLLSRLSNTAFLNPLDHIGKKAVFETLKQRIQNVTGLSRDIIWTSEDLQVLRYDKQGHYHCHYDSEDEESHPSLPCCHYLNHYEDDNCLPCRYITFFYYLNEPEEGGETAFPIADDDSSAAELMRGEKRHLCDLSNHCHEAKIRYKPKTGTALFWYNHYIDEDTGWLGDLDKMSYHGGCDVTKGIKWAASNWINVGKDKELDLDAWKNYKKFIEDYDAVPQEEDVVMETKVNPKETDEKNKIGTKDDEDVIRLTTSNNKNNVAMKTNNVT